MQEINTLKKKSAIVFVKTVALILAAAALLFTLIGCKKYGKDNDDIDDFMYISPIITQTL